MIPSEIIDLIQVVVVVGRRIMCRHELLLTHIQRCRQSVRALLSLGGAGFPICQEITAGAGIWIPRPDGGGGSLPIHWPDTIEQPSAVDHTSGHFFKVVRLSKIVTRQLFGLQRSSVAIESHL